MSGAIFLVQHDGKLVEMIEAPYDSEALLQELLAKYPGVLAGDQMDAVAPRKWLLIKREMGIPGEAGGSGRWSLDHLFLDQDAIPTLVEVKRSSDTRIRREVVGQMLDYAANAVVYWPLEELRVQFEKRCENEGGSAEESLADLLGPSGNPEAFWQQARTNLQAGRIRMVFVADEIPDALRRVVEFLNGQMELAEVLALEVKQYLDGEKGLKTLVPRLIGRTAQAEVTKGKRPAKHWDEASFLEKLTENGFAADVPIVSQLLGWTRASLGEPPWGAGAAYGTFQAQFMHDDFRHVLFTAWTNGIVEIRFRRLKKRAPFSSPEKQRELIRRLNEIPGVQLPEVAKDGLPGIPLSVLAGEESMQRFLAVLDWIVAEIRAT